MPGRQLSGGRPRKPWQTSSHRTVQPEPKMRLSRSETFLLSESLSSDIVTALAMERKFQLNQFSQTLEHSRLGREGLSSLFQLILAAQETDAGLHRAGDAQRESGHEN